MSADREELERLVRNRIDLSRSVADEEILEIIQEVLIEQGKRSYLSIEDKDRLSVEIFNGLRKLDILQELVDCPGVTEIMVNGTDAIFLEENGKLKRWDKTFKSREKLEDVVQQIVAGCNRSVNEANPIADARLAGGARVNIVLPPVALNGPIVTIRRFPEKPVDMAKLLTLGSITEEAAEFLGKLVKAGYNIFISGGTGSGKTTFLNALSEYIPEDERLITVEDNAELQILGVDNLVQLEARNGISIRELIRSALRMRPDRIIVGEVRGAEALDMLQAMNTGHDGSLGTGHGNSPPDMLSRLETMVLMGMELPLAAIRQQIASGIDILVHLGRLRDRTRKVLNISEITGYSDGEIRLNTLFEFMEEGENEDGMVKGTLAKTGALSGRQKLEAAGMEL